MGLLKNWRFVRLVLGSFTGGLVTMKRALFAVAVGFVGLTMMGCATDVDDPVVPAPAPEEQRDPPKQALSGQLRDPQQQLLSEIELNRGLAAVPPERVPTSPPIPQPFEPAE
jgi:hypothetical protein